MFQFNIYNGIIIFIIFIIIYILLIILSYKKKNNQYKYADVNNNQLQSSYFESKILTRLPIIIWHNDFNIDLEDSLQILTPGLLLKKYFIDNYSNSSMVSYHKVDRLFIIAKTRVIVNLYPPSIYYELEKSQTENPNKDLHNYYIKDNKYLDNMEIELQPKDILYVPRFWFVNIEQSNSVDLFVCKTLLSSLSSLFI
jgi:hypothetical protein|tara:strand:- start:737 stop:1327 length:591 start_codon:yes stop_codon:yes gene_type:complete